MRPRAPSTCSVRRRGPDASMREHPFPHELASAALPSSSNRSSSVASGVSARSAATSIGPPAFAAIPTSRLPSCFASASADGSSASGREKPLVEVVVSTGGLAGLLPSPLARIAPTAMTPPSTTAPIVIQAMRLTPVACRKATIPPARAGVRRRSRPASPATLARRRRASASRRCRFRLHRSSAGRRSAP